MTQVYLNGQFLAECDAKIPVTDRSYLFGEGLFESFRSHNGKIPFLKDHVARLEWSSEYLHLPFPADVDFAKITSELLAKNKLENARFKIILSKTDNLNKTGEAQTNLLVSCEAFDDKKLPETYKLKVIKTFPADSLPLAAMKTTNYLVKILARNEAREAGFDDGLLVNSKGSVAEASSANIFWINASGQLCTIAADQGLLSGVTRRNLIELLKKNNFTVNETRATPDEISSSREVFVTNSIIGVKPVVAVDHRQISGGEIGSITAMICDLWKKQIEELI